MATNMKSALSHFERLPNPDKPPVLPVFFDSGDVSGNKPCEESGKVNALEADEKQNSEGKALGYTKIST